MLDVTEARTRPLITDRAARVGQDALIRVVVGDEAFLVREHVASMLAAADGIELVAACATGPELRAAIRDRRPQVVVMCMSWAPGGLSEGVRLVRELRETERPTGVVVLTNYLNPELAYAVLGAGRAGRAYLLKDQVRDARDLLGAIAAVAAGGSLIDPHVIDALIGEQRSPLNCLTAREREVLAEVASGKSNAAIAKTLTVTRRAIEKHVSSIFSKLDLGGDESVSARVVAARIHLGEQPTPKPSNPTATGRAHPAWA